jgi:glutathione S-transferase
MQCSTPQVASAGWAGVNIDDYPSLKAWEERMTARPGVEKGRHVPDRHAIKELMKDKEKMEQHAAESRKWVQAGMYVDFPFHQLLAKRTLTRCLIV